MKEQLKGIALVLFGILLCCVDEELGYTSIFNDISELTFSILEIFIGIVGLFFVFKKTKSK